MYVLDGKHFPTTGRDPKNYSKKTRHFGRNGIFVIERLSGKIVYESINWPATYHDLYCLKNSLLLTDPENRARFESGPVVADLGFQDTSLPNIFTPVMGPDNVQYENLSDEMKEFSFQMRSIEKQVENVFAHSFHSSWQICRIVSERARDTDNSNEFKIKASDIIYAASCLYNLDIDWKGFGRFDGPLKKLYRFCSNL